MTVNDPTGHAEALLAEHAGRTRDLNRLIVHDMRSALQVVQGYLGLALRDADLADKTRAWLERAGHGADTLTALASTLSDVARLESGERPFALDETAVRALLDEAVESVRAAAPRHTITWTPPEGLDATVRLERSALARAVGYLLEHATKFSPAGSEVTVSLAVAEGVVRLAVTDAGAPVAPDDRARLFETLEQAALRRERKRYSSGLGLVFCRLTAEAHGGALRVESDGVAGATLTLELPTVG